MVSQYLQVECELISIQLTIETKELEVPECTQRSGTDEKIRTYIGEFYIEHDRTPSTTEIAKYFGIAMSTSQNYLVAMNERGLLSYQGGRLIVDKMDKLRTDRQQAPLVGSVSRGADLMRRKMLSA